MDSADEFRLIYERCYADVYRYVVRRAGAADAADLTADVFTVAWRRLAVLPKDRALPWLYATARNVVANHLRGRAAAAGAAHVLAAEGAASAPDVGDQVAGRDAVHQAWRGLPERDREVLALVGWEGLPVKDAAAVVGCSVAAFSVRLMRARGRLRRRLAGTDADPSMDRDANTGRDRGQGRDPYPDRGRRQESGQDATPAPGRDTGQDQPPDPGGAPAVGSIRRESGATP
ncbi:RNA polymerase sigma factor [Actinacidiphila bryophytorum]|uniref:RNA polymerase sigma factor n=1 Tax=Actinacidiphila bryophytorum TaxID=1436133 RepID=UPI002176ACFD|nr:sigma-70 family RNA polymerase sigma factor [Actinacidiphila bryophytorum]UWE07705.1 sigma-70 family RNA polymerase sigma factor [Actinacidiphila bryophytorum]